MLISIQNIKVFTITVSQNPLQLLQYQFQSTQTMSLFVVGSASRITSNIITQLAKNRQYSSITIADLLPSYENYHRYYRLQKDLKNLQLDNVKLNLEKLVQINQLYSHAKYDDVLFVTHDYYYHITSKTRLMELVAQICSKRSHLFFATPAEYDHYGFSNPQKNYLKAQAKVLEIAPQSTIIRSDIQTKAETFAYINAKKGMIDEQIFNLTSSKGFSPKAACSYYYANVVADALKNKLTGKTILVQGNKTVSDKEVDYEKSIQSHEYAHSKDNIIKLTGKYNGLTGQGCQIKQIA